MVITGYRLQTTDILEIEKQMKTARERVKNIAAKSFQKLVGEEAAFVLDMICTNTVSNDLKDTTIMQEAERRVLERIERARQTGLPSEYNFSMYVHLLPYDGFTYLRVTHYNNRLLKAFKSMEEYSVSEEEAKDEENTKTATWEKLHGMYYDDNPPVIDMTPRLYVDTSKVTYPSLKDRCRERASDFVVNHYLLKVSGGMQIPPYLTIPYVREAIRLADSEQGKQMQEEKEMQLMSFLIDLNEDDSVLFNNTSQPDFMSFDNKPQTPDETVCG